MATIISQEEMNMKLQRIKEEPADYFEQPRKVLSEDEKAKIDAEGLKTHIKIVFEDLPNHDKLVQKDTIEFLKLEVLKIRSDYQKEVSDLMTNCLYEHLKHRNSIINADIAIIMEESKTPSLQDAPHLPPIQTSKGSCENLRPPYSITVAPLPQQFHETLPPMQPSQIHQVHRPSPPIYNQFNMENRFQYPINPPMFNYQIPMAAPVSQAHFFHPPPPYYPQQHQPEPPQYQGITSTQQMETYLQQHLNQQKSVLDVVQVPSTKPLTPEKIPNIATGVIRVGPPTRGPPSPDAVPQKIKRVRRTTTRKPKEKCNHTSCRQFKASQEPKTKTKAEIELDGYKAHFSNVFDNLHTVKWADRSAVVNHLFETAFNAMPEISQQCIDHLYICMNTFLALQQMRLSNNQ